MHHYKSRVIFPGAAVAAAFKILIYKKKIRILLPCIKTARKKKNIGPGGRCHASKILLCRFTTGIRKCRFIIFDILDSYFPAVRHTITVSSKLGGEGRGIVMVMLTNTQTENIVTLANRVPIFVSMLVKVQSSS